ncbi:conserved hypothetical protein [Streptomyces clavuligerus]|uniref:Uncharacterized protein n=1 Tax=Streptomyces clavuligerus TaxID=1901 RepID=Q6TMS2_STRCL|nr:hypothetical protein pSCL2.5.424.11 [Streptomyces clavuligerus]EDY48744.1 conserved hypothetical protein [Streptomyces clavuligerus]
MIAGQYLDDGVDSEADGSEDGDQDPGRDQSEYGSPALVATVRGRRAGRHDNGLAGAVLIRTILLRVRLSPDRDW